MYADRRFVWCQVADVPRLHVARSAGAALLASYLGAILVPLAQITYEKQVGARMALVFVGGAVLGVILVRLDAVMLVRSTCTGATEPSMRARAVEGLGAAHIALLTPIGTPSLLDLPWEVMWACATDLRPRHIRKLRLVCHRLLAEVGPHLLAASDATCARCGGAFLRLRRCSRCRKVSFCSRACCKAYWPLHKDECNRTQASANLIRLMWRRRFRRRFPH